MDIVFIRERGERRLDFIISYQAEKLSALERNWVFMPAKRNILLKC